MSDCRHLVSPFVTFASYSVLCFCQISQTFNPSASVKQPPWCGTPDTSLGETHSFKKAHWRNTQWRNIQLRNTQLRNTQRRNTEWRNTWWRKSQVRHTFSKKAAHLCTLLNPSFSLINFWNSFASTNSFPLKLNLDLFHRSWLLNVTLLGHLILLYLNLQFAKKLLIRCKQRKGSRLQKFAAHPIKLWQLSDSDLF